MQEERHRNPAPTLAAEPVDRPVDRPGDRPEHRRPASAVAPQGATGAAAGTAQAVPPGTMERDIRDLELLADWLDSRFRLPGTNIRFGLDSVLGLVPGVGDAVTTVPAAYLLLRAHRMGVPKTMLARMGLNVAMDLALGAIPLVGDLFDLGFKSNRRNVELLRQHLGQPPRTPLRDPVQGSI